MNIRAKRLVAAFIDFIISIFFSMYSTSMIVSFGNINNTEFLMLLYMFLYYLFMIIKDFTFKNASIGKRILKIKIVKVDGTRLTFLDIIKRNLLITLAPMEILLILVNDRRLGDVWAKTKISTK